MQLRKDYIAHGSDEHAALLGLKKSVKEDKFQHKGWTFADITQFGPTAREDYIQAQLIQRVSELNTPPEVPANASPIWTPQPKSAE